ncbi:protein-L-isoaspartate O-methyltransferase [soil metagenome]
MTFDFGPARLNMVESQVRTNDVTDVAIHDAMRAIPREDYCGGKLHLAYADAEVEFAPGEYLLRPRDLAKLVHSLRAKAGETALAIAAPYAAAVLRHIGLTVEEAADAPDGAAGRFDVVICEGAVAEIPAAWLAALGVGGRLAVIERTGPVGKAKLYLRTADDLGGRVVFDATPPYLKGFEPRKSFAF